MPTIPLSLNKELQQDAFPPSLILLGSTFFDAILVNIFGISPLTWRSYLPFGLGSGKWSWYSTEYVVPPIQLEMGPLETYAEFYQRVCDGSRLSASQCIYKFAFDTNTTELSDLAATRTLVFVIFLALVIHVLKIKICLPNFSSIGKSIARRQLGDEWVQNNKVRILKFGEYVFRSMFHCSITIYGVYYFLDKPYWDLYNKTGRGGTATLWTNYLNEPVEVGMIWYYIIQCAYNIEAMLYLCRHSFNVTFNTKDFSKPWRFISIGWSKGKRDDFAEMFAHHIATNSLIMLSSKFRFQRVGSMILLLHDISDVPIDIGKLANFMKFKVLTVLSLVSVIVTWIVTRLWIFPFFTVLSSIFETSYYVPRGTPNYSDETWNLLYKTYHPLFSFFLILLVALHVFWVQMIIKITYNTITKRELRDLSEETNKSAEISSKKDN